MDCLWTPGGVNGIEEENIGTDEFQLDDIAVTELGGSGGYKTDGFMMNIHHLVLQGCSWS